MSKFLSFLLTLLTLIAIGGAAAGWSMHDQFMKSGVLKETVLIQIPQGAHIGSVSEQLFDQGIIAQPQIFKYMAKFKDKAEHIKAGEYEFTPHMSMEEILEQITEGRTFKRNVTIREGLTSFEVVHILKNIKELSGEITSIPAEGSLLPDTYDYQRGEDRNALIKRLQKEMRDAVISQCGYLHGVLDWDTIYAMSFQDFQDMPCPEDADARTTQSLKTIGDVLALAAIIEKETAVPSERRKVAGVFINRLRKGMLLQTDPTVIYALTGGKPENNGQGPLGRRLLRKDLAFDSPYNTYKYPGLPPGPIANPGRASIEAALNPEAHDYLYFVADGTGGHAFGKTLAEHNRNVATWRKVRAAQ